MSPSTFSIPAPWNHRYAVARVVLFLGAFAFLTYGCFRVLFPTAVAIFSFDKPDSLSNTFFAPHDTLGQRLENGNMDESQTLIASTGLPGTFSEATVTLTPSKKSIPLNGTTVSLRKSYTAFLYPTTPEPAHFPPSTLLTDGSHYAIIQTDSRQMDFDSIQTVQKLGYDQRAFLAVSPEEFDRNKKADESVTSGSANPTENRYPSGTIFLIDGIYYQLDGTMLARFVSETAYLSRYVPEQAIAEDTSFLGKFPLKEDWLGFADGTALSFDNGIFITDQGLLRPVSDPATFIALGLDWSHVIPASEEEIGIYTRGKIVVQSSPQPDGTVFLDRDTGEQYVVTSDSHKARIGSGVLATILTRRKQPIEVSSHALDISISCAVQVSGFFLSTASCTLPLEPFFGLPGSGYEITIHTPDRGVHINTLEADFRTVIRQSSWKDTLSIIKQQILKRYNGTN